MPLHPLLLLLVTLGLCTAAFLLGYTSAETRERKAKHILDSQVRLLTRQKRNLAQWVRENWPTEYAAYQNGHIEGYQQGVLQGPELEED